MNKIALINIGANETITGRGPIFEDGSFKYIPISEGFNNEDIDTNFRFPKYSDLEWIDNYIDEDDYVHHDPNFNDKTYGHKKRGYGCEKILQSLIPVDILGFYATLDFVGNEKKKVDWIHSDWGTYIIGCFEIKGVYTQDEFLDLPYSDRIQFIDNPHFLRQDHGADLWIADRKNRYGLLDKCFPLQDQIDNQIGNEFLRSNFTTSAGDPEGSLNFYRRSMNCDSNTEKIFDRILKGP